MTEEAVQMLNVVTKAPTAQPAWMVQLRVELPRSGRPSLNDDDVEPMIELMYRTDGICSVAVVPLEPGLAVAVGIVAPDAANALERARGLTISCARYAGLGNAGVVSAHVAPAPNVETA